jgi:hypothetical protein
MDLFDLRTSLAYGRSIEEVADFLCRSDTVEEVRRKAEELGCYRLTLLGTSAAPICFPSGALITIIHKDVEHAVSIMPQGTMHHTFGPRTTSTSRPSISITTSCPAT